MDSATAMSERSAERVHLTAPERANFLIAQAVAAATDYLDGRSNGAELFAESQRVFAEFERVTLDDARHNAIADIADMLEKAMMYTATSEGELLHHRWAAAMQALVQLLRRASTVLATAGAESQ